MLSDSPIFMYHAQNRKYSFEKTKTEASTVAFIKEATSWQNCVNAYANCDVQTKVCTYVD